MRLIGVLLIATMGWAQDIYLYVSWSPANRLFNIGEVITFEAVNGFDGQSLTFSWDFGDGTTATGATVTHSYSASGPYLVTVFGTTTQGVRSQEYGLILFVNPSTGNPSVEGYIAEPTSTQLIHQAGTQVNFAADSPTPNATYLWHVYGTPIMSTGPTFTLQIPEGVDDFFYYVDLYTINQDGFATEYPDNRPVYVYESNVPPDTWFTSPQLDENGYYEAQPNEVVVFRAEASDPDGPTPTQFYWGVETPHGYEEFNGPPELSLTIDELGIYWVFCTAIDEQEGYDPYPPEALVYIREGNQAPIVWNQSGSQTVLENETMTFEAGWDDPENDDMTFTWDLGDGRTMSGPVIEVSYPRTGHYLVTLMGVDALGAEAPPYSVWALINPNLESSNQPPYPAVISPVSGSVFQEGVPITFEAYAYDVEQTPTNFFWVFDDGSVSQNQTVTRSLMCDDDPTCVRQFELFAQDADGWYSWYGDAPIYGVYRGEKPPNGVIVSPEIEPGEYDEGFFEVRPGQSFQLSGDLIEGSRDGAFAYWHIYGDGGLITQLTGFEPAPIAFEDFPAAGFYEIYFHVRSQSGLEDPIPDSIYVWARDSNREPTATILQPGWDVAIFQGETLEFSGYGEDEDGDSLTFEWAISDGRRFSGDYVAEVTFPQPGLYTVDLIVRDGEPNSEGRDPLRRYVVVYPQFDPLETYPPNVLAASPLEEELIGPPGTRFNFGARIDPGYDEPITAWHWDFGNGQTSSLQNPGSITFNQPGFQLVRAFAQNQNQLWSPYPVYWVIYIYGANVPPQGEIVDPPLRDHPDQFERRTIPVLLGQQVRLEARADDPDGNFPLSTRWWVDGEPYSTSLTPPPLVFNEKGFHSISFYVTDSMYLDDPFPDERTIHAVDPNLKPQSYIAWPDGDITVEPGEELYFYGYGEDPNELELTYRWTFGPEANISSASGDAVYPVIYNQESPPGQPYIVEFTASTLLTTDPSPATVRVTVKQYQDEDFEPNDTFEQASEIQKGSYSQLSLDESDSADVFVFEVDEDGRDLRIKLNTTTPGTPLYAELYRRDAAQWVSFGFGQTPLASDTFVAENLQSGRYAVEIRADASKRRDGIPYGFGVTTVQPSVYLPFLVEDGFLSSQFGLINPYDDPVDIAIAGLDSSGRTVDLKTVTIEPGCRFSAESLTFFGVQDRVEKARSIVWMRVQASRRIVGYTTAETNDASQLMATSGISALMPSILVPHIAVRTDQWYTRAITINAAENPRAIDFSSSTATTEIASRASANAQVDFRFKDLFSQLPEWGRFTTRDKEAGLAGVELFGRVDGVKQVAGLNMIYDRGSNPNFFQLERQLIFPHVAKDTVNFWTGIAIINPTANPASLEIVAYDDAGAELARQAQTMTAGGKILNTVTGLFPNTEGISWLKIETNEVLEGFELFGDHQGRRLAGFEAPRFTTDLLYFPHVQVQPNQAWTGIALLNLSANSVPITIEAFADNGALLATHNEDMAGRTKFVRVAESIFGAGLPAGTTYLKVTAGQKSLVGFELFGSLDDNGTLGEQMAGILALTP
ncbi:MAG: PKD domain-containing protein [Acidobacteria bacterium]|nr:PKD domain-containing protein [Acidobacteriota bacterium]